MMNYEEMSDLQINLLVAAAIGVDAAENEGVVFGAVKHDGANVVSVMGVVDYCNNPSDAWPIILANNIVVTPAMGRNVGSAVGYLQHENCIEREFESNSGALRAAMIVFLMMQDHQ